MIVFIIVCVCILLICILLICINRNRKRSITGSGKKIEIKYDDSHIIDVSDIMEDGKLDLEKLPSKNLPEDQRESCEYMERVVVHRRLGNKTINWARNNVKTPEQLYDFCIRNHTLPNIISKFVPSIANIKVIGMFSKENTERIHSDAKKFEERIENILRDAGVKFKTEDDLRNENSSITPDILIDPDCQVYYKGERIYWIDAKHLPFYDNMMFKDKMRKQEEKYTKAFGKGMFIFNGILLKKVEPELLSSIVDINHMDIVC